VEDYYCFVLSIGRAVSSSLSFSPVMFAMTICTKYHALANLEQDDISIKGAIN
jgi:hypothetical protein